MPTPQTATPSIRVRAVRTDQQAADAERLWAAHELAVGRAEQDQPGAIVVAYARDTPIAVAELRRRGAIFGLNRLALAPGADVTRVQRAFLAHAPAAAHFLASHTAAHGAAHDTAAHGAAHNTAAHGAAHDTAA